MPSVVLHYELEVELICSETCLGRCVTSAWRLSQGHESAGGRFSSTPVAWGRELKGTKPDDLV